MFWFPTMLKRQSGLSDARVGLLGAIPYFAAFVAMLINGWHSDRRGERRWHVAVPMFISAAGLLALIAIQPHSVSLSVLLFTLTCICAAYLPAGWAIPTEVLSQSAAAASVGMINAVGSVSGFAGPYAFGYLLTRTGSYRAGLAAMMIAAIAGALLILPPPKFGRLSESHASNP